MNITLTEAANIYIKSKLEKEQGAAFRLTVKKTGCSGFSYAPEIVKEINEKDVMLKTEQGITLLVDPVWQHLLDNLLIDYVEETKTGLKQRKLIFTNPNESSRCGCGESFHVS